jgi:hypothetical protein
MIFHLVVHGVFAGFKRGDVITEAVIIEKILSSPQATFVMRVSTRVS